MKLELTDDEVWRLMSHVANRVSENPALGDKDRAMIKIWRSTGMKLGSDDMHELTAKVNEDLERRFRAKERSQIQRHDWSGGSSFR
jgi:hypothetical protein